jgi:hypothetical protein
MAGEDEFIRAKNANEKAAVEWREAGGSMLDLGACPAER